MDQDDDDIFEQDFAKDIEANELHRRAVQEPMPDFSTVTGLCRTCSNAFIYQREYGEEVRVRCASIAQYVPHDITLCTGYSRRGEPVLRDMLSMATLIDKREAAGGQYL